jgi:fructokinase
MSARLEGRPLVFGEVLFDRFPDGRSVLGGAPFNVAWHLQGFGLRPLFVSRVGNDTGGAEIRQAMTDWAMDLCCLQRDDDHPTGAVTVSLEGGQPSYEILPDQAYDHIDGTACVRTLAQVPLGMIYHGTLALRSADSRDALSRLVEHSELPVFVDVNLRAPWWQPDMLPALLKRAAWVKVNDEELEVLTQAAGIDAASLEASAAALRDHYDLQLLVVTRGGDGAIAFASGGQVEETRPEADLEIVDTVGAGDGFASVVIAGLLGGWPLATTLERAQSFASLICRQRGAVIRDAEVYRRLTANW